MDLVPSYLKFSCISILIKIKVIIMLWPTQPYKILPYLILQSHLVLLSSCQFSFNITVFLCHCSSLNMTNPILSQNILSCFSLTWKIFFLILIWVIISCHSDLTIYVTWERSSLSGQALFGTLFYFKSLYSILLYYLVFFVSSVHPPKM